jgi:prevent-host-death family protein
MVHHVGSFEAKTRLAEFLRLAERGDEVVVLRRGQRVAVIMGAKRYDEVSRAEDHDWRRSLRTWRARRDRPRLAHADVMSLVRESRRTLP